MDEFENWWKSEYREDEDKVIARETWKAALSYKHPEADKPAMASHPMWKHLYDEDELTQNSGEKKINETWQVLVGHLSANEPYKSDKIMLQEALSFLCAEIDKLKSFKDSENG